MPTTDRGVILSRPGTSTTIPDFQHSATSTWSFKTTQFDIADGQAVTDAGKSHGTG
jgi:hypothetical protein